MRKFFEKKIFISIITKMVEAVFYFLTDILMANILMDSLYGEWCYFYSIMTIIYLIGGFGINSAIRIKVARMQNNVQDQNAAIWIGFKMRTVISSVFAILICTLNIIFSNKFGYSDKYAELSNMILLGAFLYVAYSLVDFFKNLYIGIEKINYVFMISLIEYAGYLLCGIGGLAISHSIYGIEIGYIIALVISANIGFLYMSKRIKLTNGKKNDFYWNRKVQLEILGDAIPFLIGSAGTLVFAEMDILLLGTLSAPIEVGNYSIAKNIVSKATHVNYAICSATMPVFAYLCTENFEMRKKQFKNLLLGNIVVALCIIIVAFVIGPAIIKTLYGQGYEKAGVFLRTLLLYFFMYILHLFFSQFMDYQGKVKQRAIVFFSAIIVNLILDLFWIPHNGGIGAAIASCVSMVPYNLYLIVCTFRIIKTYKKN